MASRSIPLVSCSALLFVASAALEAGGWAVITVKDLPDHVVAGKPVTLTYAVRQHGYDLLSGLEGRLEMRSGAHVVYAAATATSERGYYSATFTLPYTGKWTIDILGGWGGGTNSSQVTIQALEPVPAERRPVVTDAERGRRLFAGKGCITCHVHRGAEGNSLSIGAPELTPKRYQTDYLKQFLANPSDATDKMPDLKLRDGEIASLMAFINAE